MLQLYFSQTNSFLFRFLCYVCTTARDDGIQEEESEKVANLISLRIRPPLIPGSLFAVFVSSIDPCQLTHKSTAKLGPNPACFCICTHTQNHSTRSFSRSQEEEEGKMWMVNRYDFMANITSHHERHAPQHCRKQSQMMAWQANSFGWKLNFYHVAESQGKKSIPYFAKQRLKQGSNNKINRCVLMNAFAN